MSDWLNAAHALLASHPQWLAQVDQAMYQSKHNGRNQTTCYVHE